MFFLLWTIPGCTIIGLMAFATPKCASAALLTSLSNGLGPGLRTQLHMSTDPAQHIRSSLHQTIFSLVCQQVSSPGSSQTKKCMGAVLLSSCRHVQSMTDGDVVLRPQQFWANQGSSLCLRSSICLSWSLPIFFWGIVISNTKSLLLSDSFNVHVSELYSSMDRTSERYTLNFVSWVISFDAQMVLREAEAPVARPILLLISFSELLSHDKTPPKYVNCSTWPSFVPSMLIWIAGGSREQQ